MAADAGLVLQRGQPVDLRDIIRNVALAAELVLTGNLQHREPVDRRIILCRRRIVGRRHRGQIDVLAEFSVDFGGIDKAVAAHPNLVFSLGQVGHEVTALVVSDDDLGVAGGKIVGLGNNPNAGFRTVRPGDHAADIIGIDADCILSVEPPRHSRQECGNDDCRNAIRAFHAILPLLAGSATRPTRPRIFIGGEFAPAPVCPQAETGLTGNLTCSKIMRGCRRRADQLEDVSAAFDNLSNRPAMSLRMVASLENCSVTVATRLSSSFLVSMNVFTRVARSPFSSASMLSILATRLSRIAATFAIKSAAPPSLASSGTRGVCRSRSLTCN